MKEPNLPPANIEAEEAILGGILFDPQAIFQVEASLVPSAFYVSAHKEIYQTALKLYHQGNPTDFMAISTYLADRDRLDQVGGTAKLAKLLNRTISAVNIDRYVDLVMNKYYRRKVVEAGHKIIDLGYDSTLELEKLLNDSEQEIFSVTQQGIRSDTDQNSEIAMSAFNQLDEENPIYPTGILELDKLIIGFEPGTLTLLAARASMGKSAISLYLGLQQMILHKLPVIIFSLEMTKHQMEYRLWSLMSRMDCYQHLDLVPINGHRLRQHRAGLSSLTEKEMESIAKIVEVAVDLPLYMNDNRGINVARIASEARQVKAREGKLGLVIVDYLQMMASDNGGNRSYELGDVGRGLYQLAGELSVPVLALSQVGRGVEGRQNKRPMMSDLSQSGILEMVADNIIFAYRDEYYDPGTSQPGILELILAKARHGDTGTVEVLFDKSCGMIRSLKEFA
ncbi:replicative DNA helicase [Pleurocapsa sp. CCALA 161]|uniref:replicative DNA helicase n=1 Tax=Pleurocapsa sp. CCALA 161 TaxID=2107688 RepID=UPI000D07F81B|nr:replicative DNA helicase [Pleurocapsa sp. CCALA 161]PSB12563.1 replicative DNA helicase [Pleurocapsa sp. CCALA 161]